MKYSLKNIYKNYVLHGNDNWFKLAGEPLAIPMTYILVNVFPKLTPNFITIFSFFFGVLSIFSLCFDSFILSAIFFYICLSLDFTDGKFARILNKSSSFGKRLDFLVDRFVFSLLIWNYYLIFYSNLIVIYIILFFFMDNINLSNVIYNSKTKTEKKIKRTRDHWFLTWFDIKQWIPRRPFTTVLVFIIAPLTGLFYECYILSIGIILLEIFMILIKKIMI